MRHAKIGRSLSRTWSHRKAMYRNMVTSLLDLERIVTTEAKAKELRRVAEQMITLGKRGTPHARRQALAFIRGHKVVAKLFDQLAVRYQDRPGGYTRIIKLWRRKGDNAPEAIIELVDRVEKKKAEKGAKEAAAVKKEKAAPKPEKAAPKKAKPAPKKEKAAAKKEKTEARKAKADPKKAKKK
jgi:large subunit ribosomal protein L17